MNPHQQNKIDVKAGSSSSPLSLRPVPSLLTSSQQALSPDEQRLLRMYGKIPNKKDLLQNKLKVCPH
jgi:hypothetical protein